MKTLGCDYVTAISFLPQKSYILVYIANENGMEYYHFDRNLLIMEPVRKRLSVESNADNKQPTLEKILEKKKEWESSIN